VIPTVTIEVVVAPGDKGEGEVEQIVDHDREPQIQAVVLQAVVQLRGVKIPNFGGNVMFYYIPYHSNLISKIYRTSSKIVQRVLLNFVYAFEPISLYINYFFKMPICFLDRAFLCEFS